jgi:hypothetical protein
MVDAEKAVVRISETEETEKDLTERTLTQWTLSQDSSRKASMAKTLFGKRSLERRDFVSINNDVYNLFFLSDVFGQGYWFGLYVFTLKTALYCFFAIDVASTERPSWPDVDKLVLASQFLMLPIAVAMQDDLMTSFFQISNIKWDDSILVQHPGATYPKYKFSFFCRFTDGLFSLAINFLVLLSAASVPELFLNFAALQFLQSIDNIALDMAAQGFLSNRLEQDAVAVQRAELPKRREDHPMKTLDTVFFCVTVALLILVLALIIFL